MCKKSKEFNIILYTIIHVCDFYDIKQMTKVTKVYYYNLI